MSSKDKTIKEKQHISKRIITLNITVNSKLVEAMVIHSITPFPWQSNICKHINKAIKTSTHLFKLNREIFRGPTNTRVCHHVNLDKVIP